MTKLVWDEIGERFYETGIDRVVFYPNSGPGVPWNGVTSLSEDSSGGAPEALYFNGVKFMDFVASEDFQATLEAFATPSEFSSSDGNKMLMPGLYATNQPRSTFGLCYRTLIGNDVDGDDHGYKLHLVYGATALGGGASNQTQSSGSSPGTKSWTISSVPPPATTYKPTAHFILDSREIDSYILENLESHLYGAASNLGAQMPTQDELFLILENPVGETLIDPV